jgi:ABC-type sugar transport system ATPase subunit
MAEGSVTVEDQSYSATSPRQSINRGIGFLTEDRKSEGLMLGMNIRTNITAPILKRFTKFGSIDIKAEKKTSSEELKKYSIAARNPEVQVVNLSGGNQQKVLLSRWVQACGKVLLLDEPTRGVDVGAKVEIYKIIHELAEQGIGILMISSELTEIVGLCDRVVVMCEGVVTGELSGIEISEENVMHLATLKNEDLNACEAVV